ncbi:N-acetylglucosaminidase [Clostridium sp. Marseille-Q7071]
MKKLWRSLGTIVMTMIFIFLLNINIAKASILEIEHKIDQPINKVWTIYLNDRLSSNMINNLSDNIIVITANSERPAVTFSYDATNKTIRVNPPSGGYKYNETYSIMVKDSLVSENGVKLISGAVIDFTTVKAPNSTVNTSKGTVTYKDYGFTLDQFVDKQMNQRPIYNRWAPFNTSASRISVKQFADAERFSVSDYGMYQFLKLNYMEGITANDLDVQLKGKGILNGLGKAFDSAAKKYNVSQAYLVAHSILETGNGTSKLATGVDYKAPDGKTVKVYNLFGIGAFDSDPINGGAKRAYEEGWMTPEKAVEGGAKWIAENYIHRSESSSREPDQDTLYKMKWNVENFASPWHQYATDIAWAYKQVGRIKNILDNIPNAKLQFEIPRFVK